MCLINRCTVTSCTQQAVLGRVQSPGHWVSSVARDLKGSVRYWASLCLFYPLVNSCPCISTFFNFAGFWFFFREQCRPNTCSLPPCADNTAEGFGWRWSVCIRASLFDSKMRSSLALAFNLLRGWAGVWWCIELSWLQRVNREGKRCRAPAEWLKYLQCLTCILDGEKKMIKLPHKKLQKFFLKKVKCSFFCLLALVRLLTKFDNCIVFVLSALWFLCTGMSWTVLSV